MGRAIYPRIQRCFTRASDGSSRYALNEYMFLFATWIALFLFDLILYVPSTIFQLNREGSSWVKPVLISYDKCVLLKSHNAVTPVMLEPAASRSRVQHSTTEPLRSLHVDSVDTDQTGWMTRPRAI